MLDRMQVGDVAAKHHIQLRSPEGELRFEECFTRDGFDGPYTILYHQHRPHTHRIATPAHGWPAPAAAADRPLAKRHYRTGELTRAAGAGPQIDTRVPLLFNGAKQHVVVMVADASGQEKPHSFDITILDRIP